MNKAKNIIEDYRTQVEQLIYKYYEILDGNLTDNARYQLTEYQKLLGISLEQATLIEFEILKHCQNYDQKIQSYKQLLNKNIQVDGCTSFKGHNFLNKLQQRLELDNDGVAVAYASLGNDLKNIGEFEAALILFQEAINFDYNCAVAYTGQGYIFYEQGKQNKAIKSFLKARELFESQDMLQEAEQIQIILSYLEKNHGLWNNILLIIKYLCLPKRKKRISASTTQNISNIEVRQKRRMSAHDSAKVEPLGIEFSDRVQIINNNIYNTNHQVNYKAMAEITNNNQGANIGNFVNQAKDNAQVTASNFSQTSGASTAELLQIITTMRQTAAQFPKEIQDDIIVDIDDVEEEIKKPENQRNLTRLKKRLIALAMISAMIATPIAGITDFANNAIDLGNKLGIELHLPSATR